MLPVIKNYRSTWMPSVFDFFNENFPAMHHATSPAINVSESEKDYKLEFAVPGITKDMTNVQLTADGNLMVKIESKKENEEKSDDGKRWLRREFSYHTYSQVFSLPTDVDSEAISASVNDGVLNIEMPKKKAEALPACRQIEVN